jgi:hypothetical protein
MDEHVPTLRAADIRAITQLRHPSIDCSTSALPPDSLQVLIHAISSHTITPAEQALGSLTRRRLKTLSTWPDWLAGEHKQLDQMEALGMYGQPCYPPPNAIILRMHWQYQIRRDGTRRARNCCDGSPRAAPTLHAVAATYSSCVEQPVQRLFFALAARLSYRVFGGDAQDAFAHSPGPTVPTFVHIDDAYADWYATKHGIPVDRSMVLPVLRALQGHPEAGRLWEAHINHILSCPELSFTPTTHDRTIYATIYRGTKVLLLRQVDDFALACASEPLARDIFDFIGRQLQLPNEPAPPFKYLGLLSAYNGLDVEQSSSHIGLSCSSYISRLLKTHGWDTPGSKEPISSPHTSPLPIDAVDILYDCDPGPAEGTSAHHRLQIQHGFAYRTLLGELLYAYVTSRPDIGYAVTTLSKFAGCPSSTHYTHLKNVAKYLRRTIHWQIYFSKSHHDPLLPPSSLSPVSADPSLPAFPHIDLDQLTAFVDAAHANDKRNRRSTTGFAFTLAGGIVAYRSKTQSLTATSSTEAEFIAAVSAAKTAKYLRAILLQLGFAPNGPTPIYEDNMSAIKMVNARIPTERSRHIDIQHFAIQDWKDRGVIELRHIPGIINPADDLTKPLGWILHLRHVRRLMGHFGHPSSCPAFDQPPPCLIRGGCQPTDG